jgi:hypothetical protein
LEYARYQEKISELERLRVEAVAEMERFKKKFIELHFSFNETVESSVKVEKTQADDDKAESGEARNRLLFCGMQQVEAGE